jgi:hypothetical protein
LLIQVRTVQPPILGISEFETQGRKFADTMTCTNPPVAAPPTTPPQPATESNNLDRVPTTDVQKVDGLTAMDEAVGLESDLVIDSSQLSLISNCDPYRTESLAAQCSRFYRITKFNWIAGDATDQQLLGVKFPEALIAQPFIADKFKDYMAMRSEIIYYLRITSSEWNIGCMMGGHIPYYDFEHIRAVRHVNLPALSQNNGFEVSAETAISKERRLPWIFPHRYVRIASIGSGNNKGVIGSHILRVLNRLEGAGGATPDPVSVSLYAKFDKLELAGYSPDVSASRFTKNTRAGYIVGQSATTKEAKKKSNVFAGVKEATKTISGIIGSVTDAASMVSDIIETIGPLASLIPLDKPSSVNTPQPIYTTYGGQLTHGRGIDLGTKLALNPEACVTIDPRVLGTDTGQPRLLDVLQSPTFVRSWKFTSASVVGDWEYFILNPSNCAKVKSITTDYDGGVWQPTYLAHYGSFQAFWIGSLNILLTFHTSKNVQADFRIAHFPEIVTFGAPLEDYDGDIISEVIAVHGLKEVPRNFADISTQIWRPVDPIASLTPAGSIGLFAITLDSPISTMSSAVDASIYVNMYFAAGGDFSFMKHQTDSYNPYIDPLACLGVAPPPEGQSNLKDSFSKPFPGIRQAFFNPEVGIINPDPVVFITDLTKRACQVNTFVPTTADLATVQWTPSYQDSIADINATGRLIFPFLFWRGSVRGGYIPLPADTDYPAFSPGDGYDINNRRDLFRGGTVVPTPSKDPVFFELPWMLPRLFNEVLPTHTQSEPTLALWLQTGSGTPALANVRPRMHFTTGDDFSVGPLSSCPSVGYTIETTSTNQEDATGEWNSLEDSLRLPPPKKKPSILPSMSESEIHDFIRLRREKGKQSSKTTSSTSNFKND